MLRIEDRGWGHGGALFRAAVTIFCASCSAASSLLIPSCATETCVISVGGQPKLTPRTLSLTAVPQQWVY